MQAIKNRLKIKELFGNELGQGLVEFAISLIFIFWLLAGIVDLGRAFFVYMTLRDAAQEGAVYGSFCPHDLTGMRDRIRATSTGGFVDLTSASYTPTDPIAIGCNYILTAGGQTACTTAAGSISEGNRIQVTVTYNDFRITMPFIGALVNDQKFPISGTMVDAVLSTTCPIEP